MRELPLLDETRCNSCGDCVRICPTDCLAMDEELPWLPRPHDCVLCALCVLICPADAVSIVEV